MKKRFLSLILLCFLLVLSNNNFLLLHAHSTIIDVSFDNCIPDESNNEFEIWYDLVLENFDVHLPHVNNGTFTVNYYVSPVSETDSSFGWDYYFDEEEAEYIKNSFVSSIKKWDNVWVYVYNNTNSTITKRKLINFNEVFNEEDSNLEIYPYNLDDDKNAIHSYIGSGDVLETIDGIIHKHRDKSAIYFNLFTLKETLDDNEIAKYETCLAGTGAHEFGHALGLDDVERKVNSSAQWHHNDVIMGYQSPRTIDISYKDIAGASITRGFHTANNHKWLYDEDNSVQGNEKLICSICNGVKYVEDLQGYSYDYYKECSDNHNLSSNNMMAVASYGDKDYYKCKYCRYVAPFSSIQTQNYTYQSRNSNTHLVTNNTTGLSYSFSESHTFEYISNNESQHIKRCKYCNYQVMELHSFECVHISGLLTHSNRCTKCNYSYTESHTYNYTYTTTSHTKTCSSTNYQIQEGHYINYYLNRYYPITNDDLKHKVICECGGVNKLSSHVCSSADINNGYPNTCLDCGKSITSGMGLIGPNGTSNIIKRTNNGSYILRNGIIVLVDEDIELYRNGTLVFYDENTEIM